MSQYLHLFLGELESRQADKEEKKKNPTRCRLTGEKQALHL